MTTKDRDPISWRSKVYDRIGRALFIEPPASYDDFYFIEGDRVYGAYQEDMQKAVHCNLLRRDLRALVSQRMLFVGALVVALGMLCAGGLVSALDCNVGGVGAHFHTLL